MSAGSNDLLLQSDMLDIEKDFSRGYSFLKFSTTPYHQINVISQQIEPTLKMADSFDAETKVASDQSWKRWLPSKIWQ